MEIKRCETIVTKKHGNHKLPNFLNLLTYNEIGNVHRLFIWELSLTIQPCMFPYYRSIYLIWRRRCTLHKQYMLYLESNIMKTKNIFKGSYLPTPQPDLHTPCEMFYGCICIASFSVYHLHFFFGRKSCITSIKLTYLCNKLYIKYKKMFGYPYVLQNLPSTVKPQIHPNGLDRWMSIPLVGVLISPHRP